MRTIASSVKIDPSLKIKELKVREQFILYRFFDMLLSMCSFNSTAEVI